jgi:hypothetical protein
MVRHIKKAPIHHRKRINRKIAGGKRVSGGAGGKGIGEWHCKPEAMHCKKKTSIQKNIQTKRLGNVKSFK